MNQNTKSRKFRRPADRPDGGMEKVIIETERGRKTVYLTLTPELEGRLMDLLEMFAYWAAENS